MNPLFLSCHHSGKMTKITILHHRLSYNKQYRWLTIMLYIVTVIGFKNHIPVKKRLPVRLTRTVDQELQTLHIISNWLSYPWDFFPSSFISSMYLYIYSLIPCRLGIILCAITRKWNTQRKRSFLSFPSQTMQKVIHRTPCTSGFEKRAVPI